LTQFVLALSLFQILGISFVFQMVWPFKK